MDVRKRLLADCFSQTWLGMGETPIKPQTSDTKWQLTFEEGGLWPDARCRKEKV